MLGGGRIAAGRVAAAGADRVVGLAGDGLLARRPAGRSTGSRPPAGGAASGREAGQRAADGGGGAAAGRLQCQLRLQAGGRQPRGVLRRQPRLHVAGAAGGVQPGPPARRRRPRRPFGPLFPLYYPLGAAGRPPPLPGPDAGRRLAAARAGRRSSRLRKLAWPAGGRFAGRPAARVARPAAVRPRPGPRAPASDRRRPGARAGAVPAAAGARPVAPAGGRLARHRLPARLGRRTVRGHPAERVGSGLQYRLQPLGNHRPHSGGGAGLLERAGGDQLDGLPARRRGPRRYARSDLGAARSRPGRGRSKAGRRRRQRVAAASFSATRRRSWAWWSGWRPAWRFR